MDFGGVTRSSYEQIKPLNALIVLILKLDVLNQQFRRVRVSWLGSTFDLHVMHFCKDVRSRHDSRVGSNIEFSFSSCVMQ